jgi:hypothetical protein
MDGTKSKGFQPEKDKHTHTHTDTRTQDHIKKALLRLHLFF